MHSVDRMPVALNSYALWLAQMISLSIVNYGYPIAQMVAQKQTSVPTVLIGGSPIGSTP